MRTTEHALNLSLGGGKQSAVSRLTAVTGVLATVWRLMRNRSEIGSLRDLDDHQLLDMGLRREDVREALTSSFFENPGRHLTRAARNRANRFYRDGCND